MCEPQYYAILVWILNVNICNMMLLQDRRIYGTTKLANLLFIKELSKRLKRSNYRNITANAVHPGPVATNLFRNIPYLGVLIRFAAEIVCYTAEVCICRNHWNNFYNNIRSFAGRSTNINRSSCLWIVWAIDWKVFLWLQGCPVLIGCSRPRSRQGIVEQKFRSSPTGSALAGRVFHLIFHQMWFLA